jgi:predicted Zn-dependent peptidase
MKLHKKILKNGLTIQAIEMPGTNVVTTMILAGAGSRYEDKSISGISHFLEHMFFKGANKYKTPKEVSEVVDSFGGEFNAFTGKEYVGYYVKSGKSNIKKSLDVLADMLIYSKFPKKEIEKERGVILEEMAM